MILSTENPQYGKATKDTKTETNNRFLASVFVVFVAFPYCDVLKVARLEWPKPRMNPNGREDKKRISPTAD